MTGRLDADVVVVGLGAFGSCTAWRLAQRGARVIGLEQHHAGHDQGSSHGNTRLFRMITAEHPGVLPVARRSIALFRELEQACAADLLTMSGGVVIGARKGDLVGKILSAADSSRLPHEVWTRDEVTARFPQHHSMPEHAVGVYDPQAGVLRPEAVIRAACAAARRLGATIHEHSTVRGIETDTHGVTVDVGLRKFRADQAVICMGAWTSRFLPDLPTEVQRIPMLWYEPKPTVDPSEFDLHNFPVFERETASGYRLWGHGRTGDDQVKIGPWGDPTRDRRTDPDLVDRGTTPADWRHVSSQISAELPGLAPLPARVLPCLTTYTPDGQYLIGRVKGSRILVAGAGNARAFKHCTGIGDLAAGLATGEDTPYDADFLHPDRFAQ